MSCYYLGLNLGHERSAALVKDGEIVVAIEQERLDRQKYSIGFMLQAPGVPYRMQPPSEAIRYCLDSCGITLDHLGGIVANMPGYDFAPDIIRKIFPADIAAKVLPLPNHHLAHAYSAYWPSGFDEAMVLVADATGSTDWEHHTESYTLFCGDGARLTTLHSETVAAHLAGLSTLGFIYEYVTRKAGFVTTVGNTNISHAEAGKLMGLAPFGGEQNHWHRWIKPVPGSYSLEISPYDIFLEIAALEKKYDAGEGKPYLRPYLVDLAYKVQTELEMALQHIVQVAMEQTGLKKLCIAGGVGLNSVANYHLLRTLGLEDIFIFPAAGDSGIAAGAALWAYAQQGGRQRPVLTKATLGHAYTPSQVEQAVQQFAPEIEVDMLAPEEMLARSAAALAQGHIVARFAGGAEYGPRALGHRSIMVDPTFLRMRDIVNARVKFREAFRPFAPVVPRESVAEVFELETDSPFMLLVAPIRPELRPQIPAVTHVDGTGRVQTVTAQDNPYFYQLCHRLVDLRQGPPVLLNTSFNVAGQPIVETPSEAIQTFLQTDIDYLAIENVWIAKRHVQAQDYDTHLAQVSATRGPQGLPPNQPAVTDLMGILDRALFSGPPEHCPWSAEELKTLSAIGARYKETSVLFPEHPFMGLLQTRVSDDVVWILDPQDRSMLVNLALHNHVPFKMPQALPGREALLSDNSLPVAWQQPQLQAEQGGGRRQWLQQGTAQVTAYRLDEVKLLMAMLSGAPHWQERLRLDLCLTHAELEHQMAWGTEQLLQFGLDVGHLAETQMDADSVLMQPVVQTLAPFGEAGFSVRGVLKQLRSQLQGHGYTLEAICQRLGIDSLQAIEPTRLHYYDRYVLGHSALDDLIRLFLLRVALSQDRLVEMLGPSIVDLLVNLGVLMPRLDPKAAVPLFAARIDLFCVAGLYIATDHRYLLLAEDAMDEDPVMYIGADSQGLVYVAPRSPAHRLLDLCCGSGVQGLVASRYSQQVTAVDRNPRAIRFSRFNAQLNDIRNIEFHRGDLYEPVEGQAFDTILANPPFVPSPTRTLGFRDGGATGEEILAAIIADSAAHLTPEGRLFIVTDLVDIETYAAKLGGWWQGGTSDQLVLCTADRDEILFSVPHSHAPFGQTLEAYNQELAGWVNNFRAAGLRAVNFGYILIQRQPQYDTGSYVCRTIHNPTLPIHERVQGYFQQQVLLRSHLRDRAYLMLTPGLRIRIEQAMHAQARQIELFVADDPYFTTYQINEDLYQLLQTIQRLQPQWQALATPANQGQLMTLISKGLVGLTLGLPKSLSVQNPASEAHCPPQESLVERHTKTTPTCLSAYLK